MNKLTMTGKVAGVTFDGPDADTTLVFLLDVDKNLRVQVRFPFSESTEVEWNEALSVRRGHKITINGKVDREPGGIFIVVTSILNHGSEH